MTLQFYAQKFVPNQGIGGGTVGFNHVIPCTVEPLSCNEDMVTARAVYNPDRFAWNVSKDQIFDTPEKAYRWLSQNTTWNTQYIHTDGQCVRHYRGSPNYGVYFAVITGTGKVRTTPCKRQASVFEKNDLYILGLGAGWLLHPIVDERPKTSSNVRTAVRKAIRRQKKGD